MRLKCKSKSTRSESVAVAPPKHKLHYIWVLLPISVIIVIFTLSSLAFYSLPEPVFDDSGINSGVFVEKYAREYLKVLTDIGPRVVGSEANLIRTIEFLTNVSEGIKRNAVSTYLVEYEVQIASGSFILDDMVNVYENIQNFVIRFSSPCCESKSALLVNCHFDTVPESPGAGDGSMVAVTLEVLRVLSTTTKTLKNPVIFLFNGAAENGFEGSHAFITQHRWATDVKAFINLDGAGLGGREILFRSGPGHSWLMEHYHKSAFHPFASCIAEEIFENGLIPSDTDFRIFQEYAKIPGLNMAYILNGYVYNTKLDRFSSITKQGFLQNTGDNVLALVRSIASSDELESLDANSKGRLIFFDFLGLFLVVYSETAGIAINVSVAVIAFTAICISIWAMSKAPHTGLSFILKKFVLSFLIEIAALILAYAVPIVIAVIVDAAYAPLFWYSQPWLIFGIYFCPFCFVMAIIPSLYLKKERKTFPMNFGIQLFLHAHCFILIVMVIILTSLSIRSAFVVMISIGFYAVSVITNWASGLQARPFLWLIPVLISQIIPITFYSYLSIITFTTFIPMTGRNGSYTHSDLIIASITGAITMLITGFLTPLFSILRRTIVAIFGFILIFVIFGVLMATSIGFPFEETTAPERMWVFHTKMHLGEVRTEVYVNKTNYDGSGYMILPLDRYSEISIKDIVRNVAGRNYKPVKADCEYMLACGVPVYSLEFKPLSNYSFWVEASPLIIQKDQMATLSIYRYRLNNEVTRFQIYINSGPSNMQVLLNPINQCQLLNWTLNSDFPRKDFIQESTYFVHYRYGWRRDWYEFELDFSIPSDYDDAVFEIALITHHVNYPINHTEDFNNFVSNFPKWVTMTPIVSSYESYRVY